MASRGQVVTGGRQHIWFYSWWIVAVKTDLFSLGRTNVCLEEKITCEPQSDVCDLEGPRLVSCRSVQFQYFSDVFRVFFFSL